MSCSWNIAIYNDNEEPCIKISLYYNGEMIVTMAKKIKKGSGQSFIEHFNLDDFMSINLVDQSGD